MSDRPDEFAEAAFPAPHMKPMTMPATACAGASASSRSAAMRWKITSCSNWPWN